jgi:hypothetical protein
MDCGEPGLLDGGIDLRRLYGSFWARISTWRRGRERDGDHARRRNSAGLDFGSRAFAQLLLS